ncbi:MAG: multidrug ABC transporter ATP-binding protein, partial [Rhodospirillaceae bacterium]|nr:multidrug ABC transporter ATP-binding protein [Rhodospirillaceae bacterium]
QTGVTIILTTHYIEEAEEMADRIGVINGGRIVLVEDKSVLMSKLGKKELRLSLHHPMQTIPVELSGHELALEDDGDTLVFTFDNQVERTGTTRLLGDLDRLKIRFSDLDTRQNSLEDIFVRVVGKSS